MMKRNYIARKGYWPEYHRDERLNDAPDVHFLVGFLMFCILMEIAILYEAWTSWNQPVSPAYWMLLGGLAWGSALSIFSNVQQLQYRRGDWSYLRK